MFSFFFCIWGRKIMKFIAVLSGIAALFLLAGCQPQVDCSSEEAYQSSLKEVIGEIRKRNAGDAADVEKFLKVKNMITFSSGMDRDICGKNPDQLNSFAHNYVRDQIDNAKKQVKGALDDSLKATQDALDQAFGEKKED